MGYEVSGYSQEEIEKGVNIMQFLPNEEQERAKEHIQRRLAGEISFPIEYSFVRKDGTTFPALITTARIISKNKVTGLRGLVSDITERNKAEEALRLAMDKLLLVNEKLNVTGRLTRHDIRNRVSGIEGNIHVLKKLYPDCEDMIKRLDTIDQSCKSIVKILDFAKMYEELGAKELSFIDVENTLDEAVGLFSAHLIMKVANECHGLKVLADSFLRQLFYNMIDNSEKHGETVTKIVVRYVKVDQDKLNLIYEDNGVGVSTDNKSKLFKEGFSTSGSTGYGLNLIRRIMDVYGWAIQEDGIPGKGAKFVITIPRANKYGKDNFQII